MMTEVQKIAPETPAIRIAFDLEKAAVYSKEEIRGFIAAFEDEIRKMPQIDVPARHQFSKGIYARSIDLPKGSVIVGKIHRHETLNIILKGDVTVISVDGVMRVKAGESYVSQPGAKRVIFANEDSAWMNVHGTSETDLEKIEEEFIAKTYDDVVELPGKNIDHKELS